ncbi:hypothetical protein KNE206_11120 [Kitasatospora sp. NE20-6]
MSSVEGMQVSRWVGGGTGSLRRARLRSARAGPPAAGSGGGRGLRYGGAVVLRYGGAVVLRRAWCGARRWCGWRRVVRAGRVRVGTGRPGCVHPLGSAPSYG